MTPRTERLLTNWVAGPIVIGAMVAVCIWPDLFGLLLVAAVIYGAWGAYVERRNYKRGRR